MYSREERGPGCLEKRDGIECGMAGGRERERKGEGARERMRERGESAFELLLEEDGGKRNLSRERKAFCTSAPTLCIYCPCIHIYIIVWNMLYSEEKIVITTYYFLPHNKQMCLSLLSFCNCPFLSRVFARYSRSFTMLVQTLHIINYLFTIVHHDIVQWVYIGLGIKYLVFQKLYLVIIFHILCFSYNTCIKIIKGCYIATVV